MVTHLNAILEKLSSVRVLNEGDRVLDIGCNDGTLLGLINTPDVHRIGIDPSSAKFLEKFKADITVISDFFSFEAVQKEVGDAKFTQITAIAMFYDLDEPGVFLSDVRRLLCEDGIWALELAYLPSMLTNLAYDQICHEHVTYPSFRQIERLAKDAGLRVLDVSLNNVNGGSFLIVGCRSDNASFTENNSVESIRISERALDEKKELDVFAERIRNHREDVRRFLSSSVENGQTVIGYGASTKGNIVLNHCGVGEDLIGAVCDANPEKWGRVTPGSQIPIISKEEMRARKPDILFVLIWHFYEEVLREEEAFIREGGEVVFDLPQIHTVDKSNYEEHLKSGFSRFSFSRL
jgi:NDP-4-keto-2,6-dideoxyhexose 3-C-methyltransferase